MRREVAQALMGLLSGVSWGESLHGFVYTSFRLQLWEDAPGQPALYVCAGDERWTQVSGRPPLRDLEFRAVVYQDVGRDTSHPRPADENDDIMGAFEGVLLPDSPEGRMTLGGLVHHARIDGTVIKDSGDLDGQAMMVVPIWVMVP